MPDRLRRALLALCLVGLVAWAYAPLVRCGFVGEDLPTLCDAGRLAWPGMRPNGARAPGETAPLTGWFAVRGTEERPLAALSLALSSRLHSDAGHWPARRAILLRAENLALVALAALGLAGFVRRSFKPWTGRDAANAAGAAAGVLFVVHPLTLSAVASIASRGDCLGMALGCGAAWAFLRGRQERAPGLVSLAVVLAILCAFASPLCLFLPPTLAIAEYVAARRSRPSAVRLRTALTTLVVFLGAISLEALARTLLGHAPGTPAWAQSLGALLHGSDARRAAKYAVEKLGVLLLPVNTHGVGSFGPLLAGALLLVAFQPALVAARVAPRLWTWAAVAFAAAIGISVLPEALVRVHPRDWANARALFPGAAVMAAGTAVASTALSGARRTVFPALLAVGFALLAHGNARPYRRADGALRDLVADVAAARRDHGRGEAILVLEPPPIVGGLDGVRPALGSLLDPAFDAEPGTSPAPALLGISFDAFRVYSRTTEFAALRAGGLIVLLPHALLLEHAVTEAGDAVAPPEPEAAVAAVPRVALRLDAPAPQPTEVTHLWRREGMSPVLDLDPLTSRMLRVVPHPDVEAEQAPAARWRSRSSLVEFGRMQGVWAAGREETLAWFDLERSAAWMLGERTRRIWFQGALATVQRAELLAAPPALLPPGAGPRSDGSTWLFAIGAAIDRLPAEVELVCDVLDMTTLELRSIPLERPDDSAGEWRAILADPAPSWSDGPRILEWSLDARWGDVTVARSTGRLVAGRSTTASALPR